MRKKVLAGFLMTAMVATVFTGCSKDNKADGPAASSVTVSDIFSNMSDTEMTSCDMEFGINFKGDASVTSNNEFTDVMIEQLGSSFNYDLTKGIALDADITGKGFANMNSDFVHTKMDVTMDINSNIEALNELLASSITEGESSVSESYMDLKDKAMYTYDSTDDSWYIDDFDGSELDFNFQVVEPKDLVDTLSTIGTFSDVSFSDNIYTFGFNFTITDDMTDEQKEGIKKLFELTTAKDGVSDVMESGVDTDSLFTTLDTFSGFGTAEIPVKASFKFTKTADTYFLDSADIDVTCVVNMDLTEEVIMTLAGGDSEDLESLEELDCDAAIKLELGFNIDIAAGYDDVTIEIPAEAKDGMDFRSED